MIPLGILASARVASGRPVTATYQGTATTTSTALSVTFASMPIGTPSATRTVVVGLTWRSSSTIATAAVTVSGVAATLDHSTRTGWQRAEFYRAEVPAGSIADVIVNFNYAPSSHGIIAATWALDSLVTVVDSDGTTAPLSRTVDTAAGGVALAMVGYASNGPAAWTGASERFDLTNMTTRGSGADVPTDGTPVTIAATLTGAAVDPALTVVSYQGA